MIRELIDTEVEAVVGGTGNTAIGQGLFQFNNVHQNAFAVGNNSANTAVNALGNVSNSASQIALVG